MGRLSALLNVVNSEYGSNQEFLSVYAAYLRLLAQTESGHNNPQEMEPPKLKLPTPLNGKSIIIVIVVGLIGIVGTFLIRSVILSPNLATPTPRNPVATFTNTTIPVTVSALSTNVIVSPTLPIVLAVDTPIPSPATSASPTNEPENLSTSTPIFIVPLATPPSESIAAYWNCVSRNDSSALYQLTFTNVNCLKVDLHKISVDAFEFTSNSNIRATMPAFQGSLSISLWFKTKQNWYAVPPTNEIGKIVLLQGFQKDTATQPVPIQYGPVIELNYQSKRTNIDAYFRSLNGKDSGSCSANTSNRSDLPIVDGTWHHLLFVRDTDRQTCLLYLENASKNNALEIISNRDPFINSPISASVWEIGHGTNTEPGSGVTPTEFYEGLIYDIRVYAQVIEWQTTLENH